MARIPVQRSVPPIPQDYPRIRDTSSKYYGCLDVETLQDHPHPRRITPELLRTLILQAIEEASVQSSREAILIPPDMSPEQENLFFQDEANKLFAYLHAYPVDPAATAHEYTGRHYQDVGLELFRNRAIQKGRMNSGWRYQLLARECAKASGRFDEAAGFGFSKGDFVAKIRFKDDTRKKLHIYVSVKNRRSTIGGQDWPNSIQALEAAARADNRQQEGPYICIFGIAIDRGERAIPKSSSTGRAYSENTEVWLSDFFWPFFSSYSYSEIMMAMLEALIEADANQQALPTQIQAPHKLLEAFGARCYEAQLTDEQGFFSDPLALVQFFCAPLKKKPRRAP
ncbi:MAG: hypothetical protein SNJ80_06045 [Anaerolinea sp.]